MTFPLFYQKVRRTSRLVEHSEEWEHYDKLVVRTNLHEDEMETIHTSKELYQILNNWFSYTNNGDEGCDRAEGHGWFFKLYLKIDNELVDITEHLLNHFEGLLDKLISGEVQ